MPARTRHVVTNLSQPGFPAYVRLQFDELRGRWALLAPEKVYWPDDISVAILNRCTGEATVSEIILDLAEEFEAPVEEIGPDVRDFLQEWSDRLVIRCGGRKA
ncbi:pyrroloquinoline quinone biosynthesis peptide chaperone PqqD [Roseibium aggregatum]|uniref:Pyrroloquinoline quinone biosynthesis peptide chaperone PqqD n=1 Tax=Roseibium aggregatum TaxID=187304 RepID=A0A926SAM0_9HYPH|nr:pyrroloquinoline quinone biosynthesis peptide chaperone PqqD [Roseibium aggregatum]MBD1549474.1 pyrroloquinoline quinone biosynthesis peptide chaperone PqqD [Roseibium aggregatum]